MFHVKHKYDTLTHGACDILSRDNLSCWQVFVLSVKLQGATIRTMYS